ncbi:MAG: flagellar assembly protein FliX [Rhodospirillum sp.]|nr:flagellar assembly protein FliX [Rhodospirillum sp.]MCF8490664.1 flagellar assembly protein FliX [Rhodospirillum sp.]
MKVGGIRTGETRSTKKSDKGGKAEKGAFDRELRGILDGDEAVPLEGAGPLSGVDGLLALQETGGVGPTGDREGRRRHVQRGTRMLDQLEKVRLGLIDGVIPKAELVSMARTLRENREPTMDPKLTAVMEEIELRVEVELAKLTRR